MITNGVVTIYHQGYDKITRMDTWQKIYTGPAAIQADTKVTVLDQGLKSADVIKIRLPTDETLTIANGDKVMVGASSATAPPNDAYTVIGFADNRKGSTPMWHWKVVCA